MDDGHFLNQPYDVRMDEHFKETYVKRAESGSENVKQKTQKIIENPTSGGYGGENELDDIWTTHAGEYVLGWDVEFVDDLGCSPADAADDDVEAVYLWFILHHDEYKNGSAVPLRESTDVPIEFQVRIYYPAYDGDEESCEEPMELVHRLYEIYNQDDNINSVTTNWDHQEADNCILLEGMTVQSHIDTVRTLTPNEGHLSFENASELEERS